MSNADQPDRESPADDLSGRQLGDYRLLRRLGRGAMAEVYLAEQASLNRQVAFKALKRSLATDHTYVKRFQREAQAAAALVHANIVQIHEVGCIEGVYFIAQEYVQGVNLREWIARNGAVDLRLALLILRQTASALGKAAEQGIVHRDIKPENIMLARSGEVKVTDFGLARVTDPKEGVDLTQVGMTLGTPLYMSPEQVEGKKLDPRSDLYSLGVTCYHMLAGSPPFGGETALAVAVQHLKKKPDPLENVRPDLPPALARIVHKMLAKDPDSRYQSSRELLRDVRQLQLEHLDEEWPDDVPGLDTEGLELATTLQETTQRLDSLMKTAARIDSRWGRRRWWALATVAAFSLGAVTAYLAFREPQLLANAESRPAEVELHETVERQWIHAIREGTPEAFQAVIDRFPNNSYWTGHAKKQLALLHITSENDALALPLLEELADMGDADPELKAFGLAGKYWILRKQKRNQEALAVRRQLDPIKESLNNLPMRMIYSAADVPSSDARQLREWIKSEDWLNEEPDELDEPGADISLPPSPS